MDKILLNRRTSDFLKSPFQSLKNQALLSNAQSFLYPSFFSEKGLAQDILELTCAEPDISLNTFIALNFLQHNKALKDDWAAFLGTTTIKGILYSPEHLLGDQNIVELLNKLPQEEEKVFKRFQNIFHQTDALERKVREANDIDLDFHQKDKILMLLSSLRMFYNDYKTKVLKVCQTISQKGKNLIEEDDLNQLSCLLEPKAIMFGEILPNGSAYRIPRSIARHILSLDNDGTILPRNSKSPSNHRVSSLPLYNKTNPRVFFKANGLPSLQPGKEAMLYSFYRLLNIPIPHTGLLVITAISDNNPAFYIAQASEAVIGKSPKTDMTWEKSHDLASFCKQALGAILTNPIDGKPDNFIYHQENHYLVSIDNDEVFYDETHTTKSFLFCLEAMDKPIPRSFSNFLTTLDPQLLLLAWLDELNQKNREYQFLESVLCFENARQNLRRRLHESFRSVSDLLQKPILFDALLMPFLESLSLPITISNSLFSSLQTKLSQVTRALADNRNHTSQELLERTSQKLGAYYKTTRSKFSNPLEAISDVWKTAQAAAFRTCDIKNSTPAELFSSQYEAFKKPKILDRFVEKHGEMQLFQPEEALREMFCLVRLQLTTFESASNIVDFWYKGRNDIQNEKMLEQWDALFFSLQSSELEWLFSIEKHFPRGWKSIEGQYPNNFTDVKGAFRGKRSLSLQMIDQILDKSGSFKEEKSLPGRSKVARFSKENSPVFYLKKSPEIPGYEHAATLFMRSLGLEDIPFSELLLFKDLKQGLYPVLLTQAVQGDVLDTIWQDDNNFTALDPHQTYLLILCSILLNPEDGKGDNYILTADKRKIVPIDNDHIFLPGTIEETKGFLLKTVYTELQSKTVLFCLHEMDKPVPPSVAQIFTQLDIEKFLDTWLTKLIKVNENYQNLPPEDLLINEGKKGTFFRIAFQMVFIANLQTKFSRMKQLLSEYVQITPFDLLSCLEPYVGTLYAQAFCKETTVLGRFMRVTDTLYQKDKNGRQTSRLNSIQIIKILDISKAELVNKSFLCQLGPSHALEFLEQYREKMKQKETYYQKVIRGEAKLQKTDLSNCPEDLELLALDLAFKKNREAVALHNSKLLDGNLLSKTFGSFSSSKTGTEVRLLDLRGAQNLSCFCIFLISAFLPNIEYLNLGSHASLKCAVFLDVNFKKMKRLVVSNCPKLTHIVIESNLLEVLQIKNNQNLSQVFLSTPDLTYFDFTGSERSQIHMFSKTKKLKIIKPERIFSDLVNRNVVHQEIDIIVDCIVKEITLQESVIPEKKLLERKSEMPEKIWTLLMFALKYFALSKVSAEVLSVMVDSPSRVKAKDLKREGKELVHHMIKEAFNSKEKIVDENN